MIDPFCSLKEITEEQQRSLLRELQATALLSYQAQGLTRPGGSYRDVEDNRGRFEFELQCYGRKVCPKGKPIERDTDGPHGRTIWYTEEQLFIPRIMRFGATASDKECEEQYDVCIAEVDADQLEASAGTIDATEGAHASESSTLSEATDYGYTVNAKPTASASKRTTAIKIETASRSNSSVANTDPVESLVTGLTDDGWKNALSDTINSNEFRDLALFIENERTQGAVIYPPEDEVFAALNLCPLDDVKVVIVGQDPYHGPGQGHGLAFSVRPGVRPPPSLKNIFKEAQADVGIDLPTNGYLTCWADQGVLLLNTVLTVRAGEANSHAKQGWEVFTDTIIDTLNERKEGLVFLLWGNPAQHKASSVDENRHTVIRTSHPSPLGATKTKAPFLGSRCFSRTNEALEAAGKEPIDWNVR